MSGANAPGLMAMVTGATSGIGHATAVGLAARGARVAVVARDQRRGEAVVAELVGAGGAAELVVADLADLESVRRAARDFARTHERLDILVNCAAVMTMTRRLTPEGFELMFVTNHLGPFVLTLSLLDLVRRSPAGRVLLITAPSTVRPDFDDLQGARRFRALWSFGASKAANLLFAFALADRLRATAVTVNAVHPGVARTALGREAPLPLRLLTRVIGTSPERAAERVIAAALAPEVAGVTGELLAGTKIIKAPESSRDRDAQQRLWTESERLAGMPPLHAEPRADGP